MLNCFDLVPTNGWDPACWSSDLKWTENIWRFKTALEVYYIELFVSNCQEILLEKVILHALYSSLLINLKRKDIETLLFILKVFLEFFDINSQKTAVICSNKKNSLLEFWVFFPRHNIDSEIKGNRGQLDEWLQRINWVDLVNGNLLLLLVGFSNGNLK